MYRLLAAALLAVGLVLTWSAPTEAQTIDAETVTIVGVDLEGPFGPHGGSGQAEDVVEHGLGPVRIVSVTVDDGETRVLTPQPVEIVSARPVGDSGPALAVSANGTVTPGDGPEFEPAAARALASGDLRQYVRVDPGAAEGGGLDLRWSAPLGGDRYLILAQSDPAAELRVEGLGPDGGVVPGGPTAVLPAGAGWNTGFAPADQNPPQPVRIVVLAIDRLLGDGGQPGVHGVRLTGEAGADTSVVVARVEAAAGGVGVGASSVPAPASLEVVSTVYAGVDGGARCADAGTSIRAEADATLTYCFTVANSGAQPIDGLSVDEPELTGLIQTVGPVVERLEPGASARFFVESVPPADERDGVIDGTSVSLATATGVAATGQEVRATGEAVVELADTPEAPVEPPRPGIDLAVTAYAGADGGARCPGNPLTEVASGRAVTYCYRVANTGNTVLAGVALAGAPGAATATTDGADLDPGATRTYHVEVAAPDTATGRVQVSATVTADPADADGRPLPGADPVAAQDGTALVAPLTETLDPALAALARAEATARLEETGAPDQLAFTGWESWLLITSGVGLLAGGLALTREGQRRRPVPVPVRIDRGGRRPSGPPTAGGG